MSEEAALTSRLQVLPEPSGPRAFLHMTAIGEKPQFYDAKSVASNCQSVLTLWACFGPRGCMMRQWDEAASAFHSCQCSGQWPGILFGGYDADTM